MLQWIADHALAAPDLPFNRALISGSRSPRVPRDSTPAALAKSYDLFSLGVPSARVLLSAARAMVTQEQRELYALAADFLVAAFMSDNASLANIHAIIGRRS